MPSIAETIVKSVQESRGNKEDLRVMKDGVLVCSRLPTQIAILDHMLGGGLPLGRIIEIFGDEGSGKTTTVLHILASVQQAGGVAVMIDIEHALDLEYASDIGVDCDELAFSQPNSGEDALEIAVQVMEAKVKNRIEAPVVVVIDSAASLASRRELDGDIGDSHYAPVAQLLSNSLRRLRGTVRRAGSLLIFTNQLRDQVGVVYGNPSKSTGGRALKYYASVRLELLQGSKIIDGKEVVGHAVKAKAVKNKTYKPFQVGVYNIYSDRKWGKGIDLVRSLVQVGIEMKVVKQKGAWYNVGQFKAHGLEIFLDKLRDKPDVIEFIRGKLSNRKEGGK